MIKNLIAVLVAVVFMSGHGYAAVTGNIILEAVNTEVNSITVSSVSTNVTDLGIAAQSAVKFGTIEIDSNSGGGFSISLTSVGDIAGNMVLSGEGAAAPANKKIAYTVDLVGTTGTLGTTTSDTLTTLDLSSGVKTITYSSATAATVDYVYDIKFNTALKTSLLAGTYNDTVKVEITDL